MIAVSCAVIVGILLGYFTKSYINFDISLLIQFGLYLLLFFIGIDIGKNDNILNDLKKLNKKVLFLPFITIISSLAGGAVASILLSLSVGESIAISDGILGRQVQLAGGSQERERQGGKDIAFH